MIYELDSLRATVVDAFPELKTSDFRLHTAGWDSVALDVGDQWIFKFPKDSEAEQRLRLEGQLLAAVRRI